MLSEAYAIETPPRTTLGSPIRVCFMLDCLGVAGIECQIALLLKHLDRSEVEPYVCLLREPSTGSSLELPLDNSRIVRLGVKSLHHVSAVPRAMKLARFLRREQIDVLHPLHPESLYFGAPVAKLARVPCVVRFRVDEGYWMKWSDRWLGRVLNCIIDGTMANCEAARRAVVDYEWASPESVAIIPNGVDLARFSGQSYFATMRSDRKELRVGAVANLRPVKNLDLLVKAAAIVRKSHANVRFLVAGEGESRAELESLISELGLRACFDLIGAYSDVPGFLSTLDVAVLCSRSEGSPNAIMEYMAAGRPIVATNVGGCGELIEHEQHGLLVAPGNVSQLADGITKLLEDRQFAMELAARAKTRVVAEYGVEMQARRYQQFYESLLRRKRRVPKTLTDSGTSAHGAITTANSPLR